MHGQSSLLNDDIVSKDLDHIRDLFDEIEKKTTFIDILGIALIAPYISFLMDPNNQSIFQKLY